MTADNLFNNNNREETTIMTESLISYGQGSMFKTLRKSDESDDTFIYERGGSTLKQSVVLTQTDLLEAIELWVKKHS